MPLSDPAPRKPLHKRAIECRGYRRDDGLWDIEAHMTDTQSYVFTNSLRGDIEPGEPLHDMWLRLTVDENVVVRGAEAATDAGPFVDCLAITPRFALLEGLQIGSGWTRKVFDAAGGPPGATRRAADLGRQAASKRLPDAIASRRALFLACRPISAVPHLSMARIPG